MPSENERRFPKALYETGQEPDPRFSLANERTFLAWIRTGVALIAAGIAIEVFASSVHSGLRLAAAIILILAGIGAPVQAWFGWLRNERALRNSTPLPAPKLSAPLAAVVVIAGLLVLVGFFL
ncbi:YidH family protein [Psychromicrobium sp. YIM B11713]|uniref:YidH family protein n=1 Tax=Psychromicrobium sp. YIM B11713 TaxID=3145233 RepID=UPI00374E9B7B